MRIQSSPLGVLGLPVKKSLRAAFLDLDARREIRSVVLTGTGRAFSVGADIREFSASISWLEESELEERKLHETIEGMRVPVIGACNGYALGGGAALMLACDIRIGAQSARIGFPEVSVGAVASAGATQRLPQAVGRYRAMDLLLTGRIMDGEEGLEIGLLDELTADERLSTRAVEVASHVARMSPAAIAATKACVIVGMKYGWEDGYQLERRLAIKAALSPDAAEGKAAFLEKRAPQFDVHEQSFKKG